MANHYETLEVERSGRVATIWMNRPEVFNAFNEQLIADLGQACAELDADAGVLKPEYKGKVALNGDPTKAGAAFAGVQMASIAQGGSAADIAKGVDFFKQLKAAGNFLPLDPNEAIESEEVEGNPYANMLVWRAAADDRFVTRHRMVGMEGVDQFGSDHRFAGTGPRRPHRTQMRLGSDLRRFRHHPQFWARLEQT